MSAQREAKGMLKPGWLGRQLEKAAEEVKNWPESMRREYGVEDVGAVLAKARKQSDEGND
jgi:hypothetical protein